MRLTLTMFQSLDVAQSPGAPEEDPSDGFDLGGWLPAYFDAETGAFMDEVFEQADAFLLGRRTYELMVAVWPNDSETRSAAASTDCRSTSRRRRCATHHGRDRR
jgi:hypothetical protein